MNQIQRDQWNKFGCASRSLLFASAIHQKPRLSEDDYCRKYERCFRPNRYGSLFFSNFIEIGRDMGLYQVADLCDEYRKIIEAHNAKRIIFTFSGVNINPGKRDDINHISLLHLIEEKRFSILTPSKDGNDFQADFPKRAWRNKQFTGIITYS